MNCKICKEEFKKTHGNQLCCSKNCSKINKDNITSKWQKDNPDKYNESSKIYYENNKDKCIEGSKVYQSNLHIQVLTLIANYWDRNVECFKCFIKIDLTIDHILGNLSGKNDRDKYGKGYGVNNAILNGLIPLDELQILCKSCNCKKFRKNISYVKNKTNLDGELL